MVIYVKDEVVSFMLSIPQLFIVILLYFILFFGIGFILNMLLRSTWAMAIMYPIVVILIINNVGITSYFSIPKESLTSLLNDMASLQIVDIVVLTFGLVGAVLSGLTSKALRKRGYQMF